MFEASVLLVFWVGVMVELVSLVMVTTGSEVWVVVELEVSLAAAGWEVESAGATVSEEELVVEELLVWF